MNTPSPFHQKWQDDPNGFLVEFTRLLKANNWAGPTSNIHENTANITKKVMSWVELPTLNNTRSSLQQYRDEVGALLCECGEFQLQSVCKDLAAAMTMADFVSRIKLSGEARASLEVYRQNLRDSLARRVDGELVPLAFQHLEAVKQGITEGGPALIYSHDVMFRFFDIPTVNKISASAQTAKIVPMLFENLARIRERSANFRYTLFNDFFPHYQVIIDRLVRFNEQGAAYCRQAYMLLEMNDWEGLGKLGDLPVPVSLADAPENDPQPKSWWKFW